MLMTPLAQALLRAGGRQRNITSRAEQIQVALRTEQLTAAPLVAAAFGATMSALFAVISKLVRQTEAVQEELESSFEQHPDAQILRSLPDSAWS